MHQNEKLSPRIVYPVKISLRNKSEIFLDMQKPKEFIISRAAQ